MEEIADRIKQRRKLLKLSQAELGARLGLTHTAISQWESGRNAPNAGNLLGLAKALECNPDWLISGRGQQESTDGAGASTQRPVSNAAIPPVMAGVYRYPVISWVQAGTWQEAVEAWASGTIEEFEVTDYEAKGQAFWLTVIGDSMTSPSGVSVPEGSFILVDPAVEPVHGNLVVAKLEDSNQATFKKLVEDGGQRYLKPLNPAYPMVPVNGNCKIVGVVKRATMRL